MRQLAPVTGFPNAIHSAMGTDPPRVIDSAMGTTDAPNVSDTPNVGDFPNATEPPAMVDSRTITAFPTMADSPRKVGDSRVGRNCGEYVDVSEGPSLNPVGQKMAEMAGEFRLAVEYVHRPVNSLPGEEGHVPVGPSEACERPRACKQEMCKHRRETHQAMRVNVA